MFQSTFPRGERRSGGIYRYMIWPVSIHVPTRGTTGGRDQRRTDNAGFNPRSHEGNDGVTCGMSGMYMGFNPRSHEGNDEDERRQNARKWYVSIHVPTRGTTLIGGRTQTMAICFNPRSHEGNDVQCRVHCLAGFRVSIHVPTRGTT